MIIDAFGSEIKLNDKVIYNLSGELALGIITAIKTDVAYGTRKPFVLITPIKTTKFHMPRTGVSKVHNMNCIVVVKGIE